MLKALDPGVVIGTVGPEGMLDVVFAMGVAVCDGVLFVSQVLVTVTAMMISTITTAKAATIHHFFRRHFRWVDKPTRGVPDGIHVPSCEWLGNGGGWNGSCFDETSSPDKG